MHFLSRVKSVFPLKLVLPHEELGLNSPSTSARYYDTRNEALRTSAATFPIAASHPRWSPEPHLVPVLCQLLLRLVIHLRVLLGFRKLPPKNLLPLVVSSALDLAPLLQPIRPSLALRHASKAVIGGVSLTSPRHPGISSQPRGSVCRPCSISSLVSVAGREALAVRPCASSCHMVVGHPQRPLDVPWQQHRGESCGESFRGQSCRRCERARGSGRGLGIDFRQTLKAGLIDARLTSASGVVTGLLAEIGMIFYCFQSNQTLRPCCFRLGEPTL